MKITQAIHLAQKHIYVAYHGGYYVSHPYYGLSDVNGPTNAPSSTGSYATALENCRARRVSEVVLAVTGDKEYASRCEYDVLDGKHHHGDWRIQARHFVREHREYAA